MTDIPRATFEQQLKKAKSELAHAKKNTKDYKRIKDLKSIVETLQQILKKSRKGERWKPTDRRLRSFFTVINAS